MKRNILLFILSFAMAVSAVAQQFVVTGKAIDGKSKNAVDFASAVLLHTDSTAVTATTTNDDGTFKLQAKDAGRYIVKLSYVGFKPLTRIVELSTLAHSQWCRTTKCWVQLRLRPRQHV